MFFVKDMLIVASMLQFLPSTDHIRNVVVRYNAVQANKICSMFSARINFSSHLVFVGRFSLQVQIFRAHFKVLCLLCHVTGK
jgi:hypothetical protein